MLVVHCYDQALLNLKNIPELSKCPRTSHAQLATIFAVIMGHMGLQKGASTKWSPHVILTIKKTWSPTKYLPITCMHY